MGKDSKVLDITAMVVSVLALAASIGLPLAAYQWLQNDVRIQRIKANSLRLSYMQASSIGNQEKTPKGLVVRSINVSDIVRIRNEGELPIGLVEAILECIRDEPFKDAEVHSNPPRQIKKTIEGNTMFLSFETPLAPNEEVTLYISRPVSIDNNDESDVYRRTQLWVKSEASAPVQVIPAEPKPALSKTK